MSVVLTHPPATLDRIAERILGAELLRKHDHHLIANVLVYQTQPLPPPDSSTFVYYDVTIKKGEYTYFVAGRNAAGQETTASVVPDVEVGHFVKHADWRNKPVRNVYVVDSGDYYSTDNKKSRFANVTWSRVTEPELVGYNIYRMCSFDFCEEATYAGRMDTFACEPNWMRLNADPVSPDQRSFADSTTGGLGGCFLYAVRPVGLNHVEGAIGKITNANLAIPGAPGGHSRAVRGTGTDTVPSVVRGIWDVLNGIPNGINDKFHGNGDPAGPPHKVQSVSVHRGEKPGLNLGGLRYYGPTQFATISWTWGTTPATVAPADLLGYHVEVAGSPNGPWQRLTKSPVAWWEDHYTSQGVGFQMCSLSGHLGCLNYRVIAVDEDGNESEPVAASAEPGNYCPPTPPPPENLQASNGPNSGPADALRCSTHLEWDASSNATDYYVYQLTIANPLAPHFYLTKHLHVTTQSSSYAFDETWDYLEWGQCSAGDPDNTCAYPRETSIQIECLPSFLNAYYVTASYASGGESPRSNLVFWKCSPTSGTGYSKVLSQDDSSDAIAAISAQPAGDSLACWNADGANALGFGESTREGSGAEQPTGLATSPMLHLGSDANPTWNVLDLHTDHLGTVRVISESSGYQVSRHDYYPFGEEITSALSYNTHQYTGHERDKDTGLDYMLARYYSSGTSRFVSPDPRNSAKFTATLTWNRFVYANNNPMLFVDANGEEPTVHQSFTPYPTTGGTASEAWSNARVPGRKDGRRGETNARVFPNTGGSSELKAPAGYVSIPGKAEVSVVVTTTLPSWTAPANAAPGEQQKFDGLVDSLAQHEDGHKNISLEGARKIEKGFNGLVGEGKTAADAQADLKDKAEGIKNGEQSKIDANDEQYDKDTKRGSDLEQQNKYNQLLGNKPIKQ